MKFIKNLKMSVKLLGSFLILIAAMVIIGVLSLISMKTLNEHSKEIYRNNYHATMAVLEMKAAINYASAFLVDVIDPNMASNLQNNYTAIDTNSQHMTQYLKDYEALIEGVAVVQGYYDSLNSLLTNYRNTRSTIYSYVNAGNYEDAIDLYSNACRQNFAGQRNSNDRSHSTAFC